MEKMFKKVLCFAIAFALVLSWVPGNGFWASAVTGTEWTESVTSGTCYVPEGGVTLTKTVSIAAGKTLTLDLNGQTVTAAEGKQCFSVNGTLIITDSVGGGQVIGAALTGDRGGVATVGAKGLLELHSGTLTGGSSDERGGNINVSGGTVTILGGSVTNGRAYHEKNATYGGNIYVTSGGTLNIQGGSITGGSAKNGGNIEIMYSNLNMTAGTVSDAFENDGETLGENLDVTGTGGMHSNIRISGGTFANGNIYTGGSVAENHAAVVSITGGELGGVTYVYSAASLELSGAPEIETLRLGEAVRMSPHDLTEGAAIRVRPYSTSAYALTGALADAAGCAPYFTAYNAGYAVGVDGNILVYTKDVCVCGCGKANSTVQWQDLNAYLAEKTGSEADISEDGHFYLSEDLVLAETATETHTLELYAKVTLDLRGHSITPDEATRTVYLNTGSSLVLMDTVGKGKVYGATLPSGLGGAIYVGNTTSFTMLSGIISGGSAYQGGNIYVTGSSAEVNIKGGTVEGGVATTTDNSTSGRGGNIYVSNGEVNIAGTAVITGGQARYTSGSQGRGGNLFINGGTTTISGSAQIMNGVADKYSGNIMVNGANTELILSGSAQVKNGYSGGNNADNIVATSSILRIGEKVLVDKGAEDGCGTSIYANGASTYSKLYISGGNLQGKTEIATTNELVSLSGAPVIENLYLASGKLLTVGELKSGASITVQTASGDGVITGELADAESVVSYFYAYEDGKAVGVSGNTLAVMEGCEHCRRPVAWTSWNGSDAITQSGHYKLSASCTITSQIDIAEGLDVVIDLNGKYIKASGCRAFYVSGNLNIFDNVGDGYIQGGTLIGQQGGSIYVKSTGTLNLYSGTIKNGTVRVVLNSSGDTASGKDGYGGNIYVGGVFNMYGGTVSGGTAKGYQSSSGLTITLSFKSHDRGGNIYVSKTFNMYGGTVSGGTAERGGNIFSTGTVTIHGGTISGGSANDAGSTICSTGASANVYINGGDISNTTAPAKAFYFMYSNLHISGGTLASDMTITMSNSTASNYSSLYVHEGANIPCTINVSGNVTGTKHLVVIYGGFISGTMTVKHAQALIINGKPVISNLVLNSGVLISPAKMTEGASVNVTPASPGAFTTDFALADDYAKYFTTAYGEGYGVVSVGNALSVDGITATGACGDAVNYTLTSSGILVISGTGPMTTYTSENTPWYSNRTSIKKVIVRSGVTTISDFAFDGCSNLTQISLPDGLTAMGVASLRNTGLTQIDIPSTVTVISGCTFTGCTGITQITLPSGLTSINTNLLKGTGVTDVVVPNKVTTILGNAFNNCTALKTVTLPATLKTVRADAFSGCTGLQTVYYAGTQDQWNALTIESGNEALTNANVICAFVAEAPATAVSNITWRVANNTLTISGSGEMPGYYRNAPWAAYADSITAVSISGFTTVGAWAFGGLYKLAAVDLTGMTRIGNNAFRGCTSLTSVTVPNTVTVIENNAFFGCTSLEAVSLGTGVAEIGAYAFYDCAGLTQVEIPANTTDIDELAFASCDQLTAITVKSGNTAYKAVDGALLNKAGDTLIQVPGGITAYTVPASVTTIAANAFADCDQLTAVVIPNTVVTVGGAAFYDCDKLETVSIGSGVTSIGSNAFAACDKLGAFAVDADNTTYAADATGALCSKDLTVLYQAPVADDQGNYAVADTVITVATGALAQNVTYKAVSLPDSVTTLEKWAFSNSNQMREVTLPNTITTYPVGAFEHTALTDVYYRCARTALGSISIASYNEPIKAANVHYTVVDSGKMTYTAKENNVSVTKGSHNWTLSADGVLTITGTGIIRDLTVNAAPWTPYLLQITKVVIAEGTTTIGANAFNGCTALQSVEFPATLTAINANAFAGCTALTEAVYNGQDWATVQVADGNEAVNVLLRQLSALKVTPPTKTAYAVGETLDTTGLTVAAVYSDGAEEPLTAEQYTLSLEGPITQCGKITVTVTYEDKTAQFEIEAIASGECGEDLTWTLDEGVLTITGTGTMTNYGTTESPVPWAAYKDSIVSVVVSEGVVSIGKWAFSEHSNLSSVTLPENSLTLINTGAFDHCTSLQQITIPDTVVTINGSSFRAAGLTSIQLPSGLTSLNQTLFKDCTGLTEVVIPDGVTVIGANVFSGCTNLETVTFSDKVTSIGDNAFLNCAKLTTVNYGGSRTSKAAITVAETGNALLNTVTWTYARVDAVSIAATQLPEKQTYKAYETLDPAGLVVTLTKDDGSTEVIDDYELSCDLTQIGTVTVTVTYQGMTTTFDVTVTPSGTTAEGLTWYTEEGVLTIFGEAAIADYSAENAAPWAAYADGVTAIILTEGITAVGAYAFTGYTGVVAVTVPETVTAIGENAFADCTALADVIYGGTRTAWNAVTKATGNDPLANATVTCAGILGDINEDGSVDVNDGIALIKKAISGSSDLAYDFNNDGNVDVNDGIALIKYAISH